MARRKPQQLGEIPNSPDTASQARAWDSAVQHAVQSLAERRLIGCRFQSWSFQPIDPARPGTADNVILLGDGQPERFEFGPLEVEDFAFWLDDAAWLDPFPFVIRLGEAERAHLLQLVEALGDPGESPHFARRLERPRGFLRLVPLLSSLVTLRYAWRIAQELQRGDVDAATKIYLTRPRDPALPAPAIADSQSALAEIRAWFVGNLLLLGFQPSISPDADPMVHFEVANRPESPVQVVLLAISTGVGAASSPLPSLHVCAYPPCGRTFTAVRSGIRGSNIFCSPRCGKRFHATKHTYAQRAANRAKRTVQTEEQE